MTPATTYLPSPVYIAASISLYFCQVHHTSLFNPTVIKISLKLPESPRPEPLGAFFVHGAYILE